MKNRILSVFLVAMMVAGILPIGAYAESLPEDDQLNPVAVQDTDIVSVNNWEELRAAVVNAPTDGTLRTIEITEDFSKDGYGIDVSDGKNIIIQSGASGPYTITRATSKIDSFFSLNGSNKTLTLKNIVLDGNRDNVTATMTMIYLEGGSFIMDSGAVIQNSRIDEGGNRAAAVSNLEGDFIMKPGSLIENAENIDKYGSGGVVNIGTFIMEGGSISGSKGALAGGVYNYGNVTIKGGTISGNTGEYAGGILNYMTLSVSGLVNIIGNKYTDTGEACNVYSSDIITVDTAGLDSGSRIGVTMEQRPYEPRPVNITGNNGADYSDNFISDNSNYTVKNSGTGQNQVVQLTVPDTSAPFLTAGAAVRTGHTAGSVKFTSNESGSYYYKVVEAGAAEPVIETEGDGSVCTTSETTITDPEGLTAGAKDIYIKVKDASGNVSSAIKIDIAAYTEPDISAPFLTAGAAVRTGHTAGSVKFTSNESGSYYYKVVEDGAVEPGIDTEGDGVACTTSETTITDPLGLTAGAKDIYIKVKDASGNVSSAIKIDIAAYTEPDTASPFLTAGAAVRTGHTAGSVKFTSNESGSYYYKVVEAGADEPVIETEGDGESCTTSEATITDPVGLTAGAKDIYIKVKDASGNVSAAIKIDIEAYKEPGTVSGGGSSSSGSSSGGSTSEPTQQEDAVKVIVNGKEHNAGKETTAVEGGKTAVTIELNNKVIESKIDEAIRNNPNGTGNVIMVPVADTKAGIAKVELTGDIVRRLESNAFDVSIKRGDIEYVIPAEEFTINKAAENLGVAENDFQDISIEVRIEKLDEKTSEEYRKAARENGAELIFSPVSFEIVAKTTDKYGKTKDFTISKFSDYVERIMEIPAGIDKNRITTGIVFNSDGTYSHVPTSVFEKDGRWYARVNSLTNSDYSVIYNAVTVESAEKHWAKDTINDMASRMVLIRPEIFEPDKFINRADFAEYIVRALGIYREDSIYENKFNDLNGDKSQTQAILTASEYGVVAGYPDGTFRPEALITRQEAMAMYQRVMEVTNLTGSNPERYKNYKDFKDVNDWAKSDVKEVLSAHVFNGTSETAISPKSNLTCAEALQAIKNLLVESQLINK